MHSSFRDIRCLVQEEHDKKLYFARTMNHMALHKLSEALGATLGPFLLCLFRGIIEQLEEGKMDFEVDKDFGKE
jgi:hypothetical protein